MNRNKIILTVELVPQSLWYKNLRSELSKYEWDIIRRKAYKNASYKCEVCGGKGNKWPVEAHEIWEYNDENKIQRFNGMIALCPLCHKVKHIGLTSVKGEYRIALNHLAKVNNWSIKKSDLYIQTQFDLWGYRNKEEWTSDVSLLNEYLTN